MASMQKINPENKYQFKEGEISEKAFAVFQDCSFDFYKLGETFYWSIKNENMANKIGTLEETEKFLLQFA